jgi:NADH-quinone oxidoreductase subunit M
MKDLDLREIVVVVPLLALSLFLGLYPKPVLDRIEPAADRAVRNFERKTDYRSPEESRDRRDTERRVEREQRRAEAREGEK